MRERALLMAELKGVDLRSHGSQQANGKFGSDLGGCLRRDLPGATRDDFEKVSFERLKGVGHQDLEGREDLESRPGWEHLVLRGYLNVERTQLTPLTHHELVAPKR